MTDMVTVSLGLAFLAGLVSFLSPCVFPIVPSYVGFVTGMTLDELKDGDRSDARRQAALHSALFVLGFSSSSSHSGRPQPHWAGCCVAHSPSCSRSVVF